jgi:hypothetical protein
VCIRDDEAGSLFRAALLQAFPGTPNNTMCPCGYYWTTTLKTVDSKPKQTTPNVIIIDDDLRQSSLPRMRVEIEQLTDPLRAEGLELFEKHALLISQAECTNCQKNSSTAAVRVWLQKARNFQKSECK